MEVLRATESISFTKHRLNIPEANHIYVNQRATSNGRRDTITIYSRA